jgi:predicted transcriptional regulator
LNIKSKENREALSQLDVQQTEATSQIKQMETAILVCREEIKSYIEALEDSKERFDRELHYKEERVCIQILI